MLSVRLFMMANANLGSDMPRMEARGKFKSGGHVVERRME